MNMLSQKKFLLIKMFFFIFDLKIIFENNKLFNLENNYNKILILKLKNKFF
jgi:hypothetical protein